MFSDSLAVRFYHDRLLINPFASIFWQHISNFVRYFEIIHVLSRCIKFRFTGLDFHKIKNESCFLRSNSFIYVYLNREMGIVAERNKFLTKILMARNAFYL